jgi:DNA-binding SARP family transcriptional activator
MDLGGSDRATAVLRFLAAQPAMGVHKEQLAERFWPETGERSARRSLHQVIYNIRRRLLTIGADGELQFQNDRYLLGGGKRWRDVDAVERLMAEARSARNRGDTDAFIAAYDQVDTIYVGDFLADHLFAEWAETQRRHYRQLHREAVGVLLEHYQFQGQSCRVVHLAERLLNLDPADEDAVQRLMRAHVDLGNQHLAADVFAEQTRILADGLGVPPCPESLRLARELLPGRYMDEWSMSRQ